MKPTLLAIVGDSAAGKTTFADGIKQLLGPDQVATVCTDDYHRYDRAQRAELDITALDPACNYLDVLGQHVRLLAAGEPILKPVYRHGDGTFGPPEYVVPRRFMVLEGLLALHARRLRDGYAVRVYLDPPEDLRRRWKVQRDCAKRGYTADQVVAEMARREPDAAAFIRPQRRRADIVVRFQPQDGVADGAHLSVRMALRPTISHHAIVAVAEEAVAAGNTSIGLTLGRDERSPVDILTVAADISPAQTSQVESLLWKRMDFHHHLERDDIGLFVEGSRRRHSDPLAIAQLFIAYHLLNEAAGG